MAMARCNKVKDHYGGGSWDRLMDFIEIADITIPSFVALQANVFGVFLNISILFPTNIDIFDFEVLFYLKVLRIMKIKHKTK